MALRAINPSGTATTGIIVDGVSLGDADAGYTTLAAAVAASANGDTLVYTTGTAIVEGSIITALQNLTITVDDSFRFDAGSYDQSSNQQFSSAAALQFSATTGTTELNNLAIRKSINAIAATGTGGVMNMRRCLLTHVGAGHTCIYYQNGTGKIENCMLEETTSGGNTRMVLNTGGDKTCEVFNTIIVFADESAPSSFYGVHGSSAANRVACANVYSGKTTAAGTPTNTFLNCVAHDSYPAGNNGSSHATEAPGTTTYDSLDADTFMADVTSGAMDMRFADRATAETYSGVDVSASIGDLDYESQTRSDEWFMGGDWIAGAASDPIIRPNEKCKLGPGAGI